MKSREFRASWCWALLCLACCPQEVFVYGQSRTTDESSRFSEIQSSVSSFTALDDDSSVDHSPHQVSGGLEGSLSLPATVVSRSLLRGSGNTQAKFIAEGDCTMEYVTCAEIGPLIKFKAANSDPNNMLNWVIPCNLPSTQVKAEDYSRKAQSTSKTWWQCESARAYACKSWRGVKCTASKKVTMLVVNQYATGFVEDGYIQPSIWGNWSIGQSIPPELGDLQELTMLDLGYNYNAQYLGGLIGTIPDTVSKLKKLVYFNLISNKLWGSIPEGIGSLTNLTYLRLGQNNFTGSIPSTIGNLRKLQYLVLSNNEGLQGTIPDSFGGLVSLTYLGLQALPLTGNIPSTMSALTNLYTAAMGNMQLSGSLPDWFSSLTSLNELFLDNNQFTGSIPKTFSALSNLTSLTLASNKLTGSIPAEVIDGICRNNRTVSLDFSKNQLTGPFPYSVSKCPSLETLTLSDNSLSGPFPPLSFFKALPVLAGFNIGSNRFYGTVPRELTVRLSESKGIPRLQTMNISNNMLTGPPPRVRCLDALLSYDFSNNQFSGSLDDVLDVASLANCTAISFDNGLPMPTNITLDLSSNQFQGGIPDYYLTLPGMQELRLRNNQLQGSLPDNFKCSKYLQVLSVSGNSFSGGIPTALGTCTVLQSLSFAGNKLTGTIPETLKGIGASLQMLELQENQLTGSLPGSFNYFQQLRFLNVSLNSLSGSLSNNISQLPNLMELDISGNAIGGPLPEDMSNLTVLNTMDFSSNAFNGSIPITLAPPNLPLLTYLDLSRNSLNGPIPWGFTNTSASSLEINLSQNNLSGPIPGGANSTFALSLPESAVAGNPGLCGGSGYPPCPDPNAGQLSTGALVGICVGAGIALIGIAALTFWLIRKRNEWAGGTMLVFEKLDFHLTVDDILEATENFSEKYKLGRGGFGTVYRATLQDGRTVAIKRLASQSTQGDREFEAEMQTLGNIRHRNLVVLVAAYIAPPPSSERLLIYNFLSGGSLDNILSSTKDMPKDSPYREWEVRRRIALDVARGMKYLHHDCTPRIIHRDMKPANVLMDDQLVAHVADFGLAREMDATKSHMSTAVFGTIGYLAPEYTQRGRLTFKSDVFAYGVLLLQLITGKQPTDEDVAERGLARWVGASSTTSIIDDRMETGPYTNQVLGAIKLGLLCTSRVPADRPSMAEVVHLLENLDDFAKGITVNTEEEQEASVGKGVEEV